MGTTIIRDNVHGDIALSDDIAYEIINAPEFQRLKRITQLGGGQHVFIGATHTRFAHSVGVYHLISKFFENENIITVAPFNDNKNRLTVKVAGLLHDIGHGPFSHTFEHVADGQQSHEQYSAEIITNSKTTINAIILKYGLDPTAIANIIQGKHEDNLMNLLVSSQLDADRLDYLLRDSENAGVSYSKVDVNWIIRHAKIIDGKMVFPKKTMYAIEAYLLGRYYMYNQVYCHKTSLAFDRTLHNWFLRLNDLIKQGKSLIYRDYYNALIPLFEQRPFLVEDYLELDDYSFSEIIRKTAKEEDEILSDFGHRIMNRNFLEGKTVEVHEVEIWKAKIAKNFDLKYYFAEKDVDPIEIYNNKTKQGKDERIYLESSTGVPTEITKYSSIVSAKEKEKNKKIIFIPKN